MNPKTSRWFAFFSLPVVLASIHLASAKPRWAGPPWPETFTYYEGFDEPLNWPTNQAIDSSVWVESWSGYALNRQQGSSVTPWIVPMVATNGQVQVEPRRGALRFWYMPSWNSSSTMLGNGPGTLAMLATLAWTNSNASSNWWSIVISQDGNEIDAVCQTESGPMACLSSAISFQAGAWHEIAVCYSETNCLLFIDGQQVSSGDGLITVPTNSIPVTSLVIGSGLDGTQPAAGQIEEFAAFSGHERSRWEDNEPFGLDVAWEIAGHYAAYSPLAARGPISAAEEEALQERLAAARLREASTGGGMMQSGVMLDGGSEMGGGGGGSYDPTQGFGFLTPQVTGTNAYLTLTNCDPTQSYDILFLPSLTTNISWSLLATGAVGQTTFNVLAPGSLGVFKGMLGTDSDGDGIPDWMDADPHNASIGVLSVTIDYPANSSTIY